MAETLKNEVANFLQTPTSNLPEFLAHLSVARWPRGKNRAVEDSNPILYTVINTIMGWAQFITVDEEILEENENPEDKLELIKICSEALCKFCSIGQRSLWLSFPELFDMIYMATKSLLISNTILER